MKKTIWMSLAAGLLGTAPLYGAQPTALQTPNDTLSYTLGRLMGASLVQPGTPSVSRELNRPLFFEAIGECLDAVPGRLSDQQAAEFMQRYLMEFQQKQIGENRRAGEEFLAANRQKPGVQVTPSGLQYRVEKEGTGSKPTPQSIVTMHYTMKRPDGSVIDSSLERGEPMETPLGNLIPGVIEGMQLMPEGSKYTFYLPADLAYGERGAGGAILPNQALVFEVELLGVGSFSSSDTQTENPASGQ